MQTLYFVCIHRQILQPRPAVQCLFILLSKTYATVSFQLHMVKFHGLTFKELKNTV